MVEDRANSSGEVMFHFSFYDYLLHELIINKKIGKIIRVKNEAELNSDKLKKTVSIVKSIVANYLKSAGLTSIFQRLEDVYQAKRSQMEALENSMRVGGSVSFFDGRSRNDDMGYTYYQELIEVIVRFSKKLIRESESNLLPKNLTSIVLSSDICGEISNILLQIHDYADNCFYSPINKLLDFHEYLSGMNICVDRAGWFDCFHYLLQLESYLSQFSIPVNGDTNFKRTAQEILSEIDKIRGKLSDDKKRVIDIEITKIRAFNMYVLSHIQNSIDLDRVKDEYKNYVQENVRKIEDKNFPCGWLTINSNGYLVDYLSLFSELHNKITYLKKILINQPEFDCVIQKIYELRKKHVTENQQFVLKRYISKGEFESLKKFRAFTQNARYSTSENAKWFFYSNGSPGVTNEYLCEVQCLPETLTLIRDHNQHSHAFLIKENEPDCVGIHEEVLGYFNTLFLSIKVTKIQNNATYIINPIDENTVSKKLIERTNDPKHSLYFSRIF